MTCVHVYIVNIVHYNTTNYISIQLIFTNQNRQFPRKNQWWEEYSLAYISYVTRSINISRLVTKISPKISNWYHISFYKIIEETNVKLTTWRIHTVSDREIWLISFYDIYMIYLYPKLYGTSGTDNHNIDNNHSVVMCMRLALCVYTIYFTESVKNCSFKIKVFVYPTWNF